MILSDEVPATAEFVVVGAGAVGCGVAWALTRSGRSDVLVLDANPGLALGTTAFGAGMFGLLRPDLDRMRLDLFSLSVFRELTAAGVMKPGFEETGSFRVAMTEPGVRALGELKELADKVGVECHLVGQKEVAEGWPLMDASPVRSALYVPHDGVIEPVRVAQALLQRAQEHGARLCLGTRVHDILIDRGRVTSVVTDRGRVDCTYIIDAAGPASAAIARTAGLTIPLVPVRHSYYVTTNLDRLTPGRPAVRVAERGVYCRERGGGLMVGGFEATGQSLALDPRTLDMHESVKVPAIPFRSYESFQEMFKPFFPSVAAWPHQSFSRGWPTFTPDGRPVIGESSEVPGFVFAAGCNAHGIAGAPAIGQLVVDALAKNDSPYVCSLSPDRFAARIDWDQAIAAARGQSESYLTVERQAVAR